MNPNREELIFGLAVTKTGVERAEFLDRECGGDNALRQRLEALLAAHDAQDSFLEPQAPKPESQPVNTIKVGITDSVETEILDGLSEGAPVVTATLSGVAKSNEGGGPPPQ